MPFVAVAATIDAGAVVRGICRLLAKHGATALTEVALPNGRRADILAIDRRGVITIVEVKVARADLVGDAKWPDYLDYCDRYYWGLAATLDPAWIPDGPEGCGDCGLIIADRYDAVYHREAATRMLSPARRRSETLRIARLAMQRMMQVRDPELAGSCMANDAAY